MLGIINNGCVGGEGSHIESFMGRKAIMKQKGWIGVENESEEQEESERRDNNCMLLIPVLKKVIKL